MYFRLGVVFDPNQTASNFITVSPSSTSEENNPEDENAGVEAGGWETVGKGRKRQASGSPISRRVRARNTSAETIVDFVKDYIFGSATYPKYMDEPEEKLNDTLTITEEDEIVITSLEEVVGDSENAKEAKSTSSESSAASLNVV